MTADGERNVAAAIRLDSPQSMECAPSATGSIATPTA